MCVPPQHAKRGPGKRRREIVAGEWARRGIRNEKQKLNEFLSLGRTRDGEIIRVEEAGGVEEKGEGGTWSF